MKSDVAPPYAEPGLATADPLVREVLGGNKEAFATLVRRYEGEVWKIATVILGDPEATRNLVQQTFLIAYRRLGDFEPGADFGRWVKGIVRNLVKKELRRTSRERRWMASYRQHLLALYDDETRAAERADDVEHAMAACRQSLSPEWALVLKLRYEEALSVDAVSVAIGRTAGAVRQLLFRAREALRLCIRRRLAT